MCDVESKMPDKWKEGDKYKYIPKQKTQALLSH
jgi:hypothetical protein